MSWSWVSRKITGARGPDSDEEPGTVLSGSEAATIRIADVPLSDEQHLLIVALFDSIHRCGECESNRVIAQRLGWSITKLNRKLDAVCSKFHLAGVSGLKGASGSLAATRRTALVDYCVRTSVVSPGDFGLLKVQPSLSEAQSGQGQAL